MKLLTPKAAVKISKQIKQFEQLMKEYSIENIDEFKKILKNSNNIVNTNINEFSDLSADEIEFFKNNELELRKYCTKIGLKGEELAFNLIINAEIENGAELISKINNECILKQDAKQIKIKYCDTENHKQQGFDIIKETTENSQTSCIYYEVKTTTRTDSFKYINLSKSQLQYALKNSKQYCVIRLLLSKYDFKLINQKFIFNMLECLSNGSVKPEIDDVLLRIL